MASRFRDLVRETTIDTGAGVLALAGAVSGEFSFAESFAEFTTFAYVIKGKLQSEVGYGHREGNALHRDTVKRSTSGDALVNFSAGVKQVYCALIAADIDGLRPHTDEFNPSNGQTVFILATVPEGELQLFVRGVRQRPAVDFTVSGTSLTWLDNGFTLAPGDILEATY